MERFNARRTFVFMLKKTSFTLGLMLGLAFAVPLFLADISATSISCSRCR